MAGIKDIFNMPKDMGKVGKKNEVQKTRVKNQGEDVYKAAPAAGETRDQAQISKAAREMLTLKIEAEKYFDDVKSSETLSDHEVKAFKDNLKSKYYLKENVIDTIVDKLIDFPNFIDKPSK